MKLPTAPTPACTGYQGTSIMLYGQSKIGKSTLASQFPKPLFIATEPGLRALTVHQIPVSSWEEFLAACALLGGEHDFKTIIIDTIDVLYRLCADWVCARKGIKHESELDFGKAYGPIKAELYRVLTKLAHLDPTLILISHSQDKELEVGRIKRHRIVPTLPESLRQIVIGLVDMILFADIQADGTRIMHTKSAPDFDAGDRFNILPPVIPLTFAALEAAFRNKETK